MSNLADYVERLSHIASSLATSASSIGRSTDNGQNPAGPFTRAVLDTPLGDLIRDIDTSEIGLFTLVQPSTHARAQTPQDDAPTQKAEVARVSLPVATPLRRPPAASDYRRQDGQRQGEYDPEVYANAAQKFLDRYQSIRHMPRYQEQADYLIEQLAKIRQSLSFLNEQLKQAGSSSSSEPQLSPSSKLREEERHIELLNAKKLELEKRKHALQQRKQRAQPKLGPKENPVPVRRPITPPDEQEETFWNTPGAAARTLHFTDDLLTDEQIDIGDMSALASPLPGEIPARAAPRHSRAGSSRGRALQFTRKARGEDTGDTSDDGKAAQAPHRTTTKEMMASNNPTADDSDSGDDRTVILDKLAPSAAPDLAERTSKPSRPAASALTAAKRGTPPPAPPTEEPNDPDTLRTQDTDPRRKTKVRVTTDTERIVAKIWATVGDVVMPGHAFDPSGSRSGPSPPKAKETMAHLESLASNTPAISSPSASSISFSTLSLATAPSSSNQPTPQQILTARMLLALLNSPPSYSMPLNKLREALSSTGAQGTMVTRPIYSCVAKKLLKIERGGGEQVVKFDI